MSVLEKAQRLAALARTYAEGQAEEDQRRRIDATLRQLEAEVAQLRAVMELHARARGLGISLEDASDVITGGLDALRTRASQGLPTPQALQVARDKCAAGRRTVESATAAAWAAWAHDQVSDLRVNRVKRLGPQHRLGAEDLVRRLRSAANPTQLNASLVGQFLRDLEQLRGTLANIGSDDPVIRVFDRIRLESLTLADLTDEELTLLRSDEQASSQISLRLA